jgi:DNA-binding CsgD family transcriptional regulator
MATEPHARDGKLHYLIRELEEVARHAGARSDIARLAHALKMTVVTIAKAFDDPALATPARPGPAVDLTRCEIVVAQLVRRGLTNQQVAKQLHVSPHTVNYHLRQIYRKLGVRSRVELAGLTWPTEAA